MRRFPLIDFSALLGRRKLVSGGNASVRLNLGCGGMYLPGWVNVDLDPKSHPDLCCDFQGVRKAFLDSTVDEILMVHSISYLRLWEARAFFRDALALLKPGAKLTLEFPDIAKCAGALINNEGNGPEYLEAVRAIYAFDMTQIQKREPYIPYAFGWSAWHMSEELKAAGFASVCIEDPQTHGPRVWRDVRVVASK